MSYCGGLPAPEDSNNPLGYKFSWSSRGVLLALKNSAKFYEGGQIVEYTSEELMTSAKPIPIYPGYAFVGYPNRDSTTYKERYNIPEAQTILRGTLRYAGFPEFVKTLVDIGFLDDTPQSFLAGDANEIPWVRVNGTERTMRNPTRRSSTRLHAPSSHFIFSSSFSLTPWWCSSKMFSPNALDLLATQSLILSS